jgi:hypothetical protein
MAKLSVLNAGMEYEINLKPTIKKIRAKMSLNTGIFILKIILTINANAIIISKNPKKKDV